MPHKNGEDHPSGLDWRDMRTNAVADARSRRLHGFVRQVRVASGCLNLSVTEELADHGKALAKGQRPGRKSVSEVVNSHACEAGLPWPLPV